jgi:DNA polymerase-3 subunit alpha
VKVRVSSTFACARPIRCWKAPSRPTRSPAWPLGRACRRRVSVDRNNLFGALEYSVYSKDYGVQPIIGCALAVSGVGAGPTERWARTPTITLLVQNERGYLNLSELSSIAYLESGEMSEPVVPWAKVVEHAEGLILLSGGTDGPVDALLAAGKTAEGEAALAEMQRVFGDRFYVELQRHGLPRQAAAEPGLVHWAYEHDAPLVATNDVYYAKPAMYDAHDALLCISDGAFVGQDERRRVTPEHWFKPAEDMRKLFADLPEACDNTLDIARRCAFMVQKRDPILPSFPTGDGRSEPEELTYQAEEGLRMRLAALAELAAPEEEYWERLRFELGIIIKMGFPGYFLIVSDFIKWGKEHGIPVGPGGARAPGRWSPGC